MLEHGDPCRGADPVGLGHGCPEIRGHGVGSKGQGPEVSIRLAHGIAVGAATSAVVTLEGFQLPGFLRPESVPVAEPARGSGGGETAAGDKVGAAPQNDEDKEGKESAPHLPRTWRERGSTERR